MLSATYHSLVHQSLTNQELILFIGPDLPAELTGIPSRSELARKLAASRGLDTELSLSQLAQRVGLAGRWDITDFILREVNQKGAGPRPFHTRVASLVSDFSVPYIITNAYDSMLQVEFDRQLCDINTVIRGSDVSFLDGKRPTIIKLYGDAKQPESLIITETDHFQLLNDPEKQPILELVRSLFRKSTILFIGYNLEDPDFRFIVDQIFGQRFSRPAYAVWPELPISDVQMWQTIGITILNDDPLGLLNGISPHKNNMSSRNQEIQVATQSKQFDVSQTPEVTTANVLRSSPSTITESNTNENENAKSEGYSRAIKFISGLLVYTVSIMIVAWLIGVHLLVPQSIVRWLGQSQAPLAALYLFSITFVSILWTGIALGVELPFLPIKTVREHPIWSYLIGLPLWLPIALGAAAGIGLWMIQPLCESPAVSIIRTESDGSSNALVPDEVIHVLEGERLNILIQPLDDDTELTCRWSYNGRLVRQLSPSSSCLTTIVIGDELGKETVDVEISQGFCSKSQLIHFTLENP